MGLGEYVPFKLACEECGGDNIRRDAFAVWDTENQCWELGECFDETLCLDCEESVNIKEEIIK